MASWKGAKVVVGVGNIEGWGKVLELPENKDQFRLGYQLSLGERDIQTGKGKILPMQENFTSVGHIFGDHVAMIDEIACNEAIS